MIAKRLARLILTCVSVIAGLRWRHMSQCCNPCEDPLVVNIPGTPGADGGDGIQGDAGGNGFGYLTAPFVMPASGANVTIAVNYSGWAANFLPIFIENSRWFEVQGVPSLTSLVVKNLGYADNAAPGTVVAIGSKVVPAGERGSNGTNGSASGSIPFTTKGDILSYDGASNVRIGAGANGTRLVADSTQASGQRVDKVDLSLAAEVKNSLPVANGGTGAANSAAAAVNLAVLPLTGGILTGNLELDGADPRFYLKKTTNAVDEKYWVFRFGTSNLSVATANDALAVFQNQITFNRIGAAGSSITINPNLTLLGGLFITTSLYTSQVINTALIAGNNNDVDFGDTSYVKIKAGPAAPFAITGIANGANGRRLTLYNSIAQNLTISDSSGASAASNRILTMTGADFVSTGICSIELVYDGDFGRWILLSANG